MRFIFLRLCAFYFTLRLREFNLTLRLRTFYSTCGFVRLILLAASCVLFYFTASWLRFILPIRDGDTLFRVRDCVFSVLFVCGYT